MFYKLANSRPARAVDTSDNSTRVDGDGGETAGISLAGVGAVGALGSQIREIPFPQQSPGAAGGSITSRRSRTSRTASHRAAQSPGSSGGLGNTPLQPGGATARRTSAPSEPLDLPDPTDPPSSAPDGAPPFALKKRRFRIGTWNMRGRQGPSNNPKIATAKMLMQLEGVDLLVLTETHSTDASPPSTRGLNILLHSGISTTRAGVAICAIDNGHWSSRSSYVLVPGHAVLCEVYHSVSTESFHLLGVYGDISNYAARALFYEQLYDSLSDVILTLNDGALTATDTSPWRGCFAAGDWNFLESDSDRFPYKPPTGNIKRCRALFNNIKSLCLMKDTAGSSGSYRHHTFAQNANGVYTVSRLDRVYRPLDGWTASAPRPVPTNHSDHHFVWSDCFVSNPKVELAVPAPRLPPLTRLEDGPFWPQVLLRWSRLSPADVSLPSWTAFKKDVLSLGLAISHSRKKTINTHWKSALQNDVLSADQLADITFAWGTSPRPETVPWRAVYRRWSSAIPRFDLRPPPTPCSRKSTRFPLTLEPPAPPSPTTPHPPDPPLERYRSSRQLVADLTDKRIAAKKASQLRRFREMERLHSSAWYNLSSNKEADERGSRASVSVEGLRSDASSPATTDLRRMLHIAHTHFRELHTPAPMTDARQRSQATLLSETAAEYLPKPGPASSRSGDFTMNEILALKGKMPNTAPGPDGLPYGFYKELSRQLDSLINSGSPVTSFWDMFLALSNEIKLRGSNRCHFKLANLSLFYKKGDPTLVSNYRPISSMNTDCKMYTNLVNGRISPWAVAKIHPDQAGFVPGRLITDHTRLASEVAHLSNTSGTDGYIVSLDQAKAYDKTDVPWLLRVLRAMGIPADLISLISDVTSDCKTRVRINSGLSSQYTLNVGLRQGDPLSPILYDFSIEPLGMRMRNTITGISCLGLTPAKLLMYADDMNLFTSPNEDFPLIRRVLDDSSLAIGCRFNLDKTDILLIGSLEHRSARAHPDIVACFDGAYILPPDAPLRVLGVWVGSPDLALPRWKQIASHVKKLISQWNSIGASILNRVLLAKALMLSRCYYLLDGNSIPPAVLRKISNMIQRFVRGSYSSAPYYILESPLSEGGLNCPSLATRALAYDAKFMSDLISGPASVPWRAWTFTDLAAASVFNSSSKPHDFPGPLNPLLQSCHCRYTLLQPRVRAAWRSLRRLHYDVRCSFPSQAAVLDMPSVLHPSRRLYHRSKLSCLVSTGLLTVGHLVNGPQLPATPRPPRAPRRFLDYDSSSDSATDTFELAPRAGRPKSANTKLRSRIKGVRALAPGAATDRALAAPMCRNILQDLSSTSWSVQNNRPTNHLPGPRIRIWPNMTNALGCARILTGYHSLLASSRLLRPRTRGQLDRDIERFDPYPAHLPACHDDTTPTCLSTVKLWTDGSAFDNGLDSCVAGAAWVSSHGATGSARILDAPASNNVAEVVAVVLSLLSWRHSDILIHTDSKYVIDLAHGRLLSMERDGWIDNAPSLRVPRPWTAPDAPDLPDVVFSAPLLRYLLYLLRSHDGYVAFKWVKAHNGDTHNTLADSLAKTAAIHGTNYFSIAALSVPPHWVDSGPVLNHQSLSFLTEAIIQDTVLYPSLGDKSKAFRADWSAWALTFSTGWMDILHHLPNIWKVNIPVQLRELLWKEINSSLPLGKSWASRVRLGQACPCDGRPVTYRHVWVEPRCEPTTGLRATLCRCGDPLSLTHIWMGCPSYDMEPFYSLLRTKFSSLVYLDAPTTNPDRWLSGRMWFPLLALRSLESGSNSDHSKILGPSRRAREWALGALLWFTWRMRMKEAHSSSMTFSPRRSEFRDALTAFMDEYKPSPKELRFALRPQPSKRPR